MRLPCMLREPERLICAGCDQTMIHLHPTSLFLLDELLENPWLKAIQIHKDVDGLSIMEMTPSYLKVMERKCLVLRGEFSLDELECLRKNLPARGLFLSIVSPDMAAAKRQLDFVRKWR